MSVPSPAEGSRVKVCVLNSEVDCQFAEQEIVQVLENSYNIQCYWGHRDCHGNQSSIKQILDAIQKTSKTVVVFSKDCEKDYGYFEQIICIEKCQRKQELNLILLLCPGVDKSDIPVMTVLTKQMIIRVDSKNWVNQLVTCIKDTRPLHHALPAGNLAVGQFWSHWFGFDSIVLPHIATKIKESALYKGNPERMPLKLFEVITSRGDLPKLEATDNNIRKVGLLMGIKSLGDSARCRDYKIPVFAVTDPGDHKVYCFAGNYPNTLTIIPKLKRSPNWQETAVSTDQGIHSDLLSEGDVTLQSRRFYAMMDQFARHPRNAEKCKWLRIVFHDGKQKLSNLMLKAVKEELNTVENKNRILRKHEKKFCIFTSEECPSDHVFRSEVEDILKKEGFELHNEDLEGSYLRILQHCLDKAHWLIFIISRDTLKCGDFERLCWQYHVALHSCITDGLLRVIPVLVDITEKDLPDYIQSLAHLQVHEHDWKTRLPQILRSRSLSLGSRLPAMDVATGLAWAYVLNYLAKMLDVYIDGMNKFIQKKSTRNGINFPKKLFVLVPASCQCTQPIEVQDSAMLDKVDVFPFKIGSDEREYLLHVYRLRTPAVKEVFLAAEYATPLKCLYEMHQVQDLSALTAEDLPKQAWKLRMLINSILEHSIEAKKLNLFSKVKLVYYDDIQKTAGEALSDILQADHPKYGL